MTDKYDYVKRRLKNLSKIARETKISRRTLQNMRAHTYEPRHETVETLYNYFKEKESK